MVVVPVRRVDALPAGAAFLDAGAAVVVVGHRRDQAAVTGTHAVQQAGDLLVGAADPLGREAAHGRVLGAEGLTGDVVVVGPFVGARHGPGVRCRRDGDLGFQGLVQVVVLQYLRHVGLAVDEPGRRRQLPLGDRVVYQRGQRRRALLGGDGAAQLVVVRVQGDAPGVGHVRDAAAEVVGRLGSALVRVVRLDLAAADVVGIRPLGLAGVGDLAQSAALVVGVRGRLRGRPRRVRVLLELDGATERVDDRGRRRTTLGRYDRGGVTGVGGGGALRLGAELLRDHRSGPAYAVEDGVRGRGVVELLSRDQVGRGPAVGVVRAGAAPGQAAGVVEGLRDQTSRQVG